MQEKAQNNAPPSPESGPADTVTAYGIYEIDGDERLKSWNPGAENLFGLRAEQVVGQPYAALFDKAEVDGRMPERNLSFVREYGHLKDEQWRIRRDGSRFLARFTLDVARDASGRMRRLVEVVHDVTEERSREQALYYQATRDALTGVMNRGHFMQQGALELERARRFRDPLSLALIDIDHFKRINDIYGHAAGDEAIIRITRAIEPQLRQIDTLARVGGEEFAILLPRANEEVAYAFMQRIRRIVADTPLRFDGNDVNVTISTGIAQFRDPVRELTELMRRADVALYRAKHEGRNQVQIWRENLRAPGGGLSR